MGKPNGCRLIVFMIVTFLAVLYLVYGDDQTLQAFAGVFLGIGGLAFLVEAWKLSGECECMKECMKSDEFETSNDLGSGPRGLQPRFNIENIYFKNI